MTSLLYSLDNTCLSITLCTHFSYTTFDACTHACSASNFFKLSAFSNVAFQFML